jgi:DNA repair protein SbcD/Mre11
VRFTFIHAADLHLGAASAGVKTGAPSSVREALDASTYRSFEALIDLAIDEAVDFVLFAGDQYHEEDRNLPARLAFQKGIGRLHGAGIRSFVIHGNHDPLGDRQGLALPDSCHTFGVKPEAPVLVERDGTPIASVFGLSYRSAKTTSNLVRERYPSAPDGDLLTIAMLHGNAEGEKEHANYAPFSADDLREKGYGYWALGHVHTHRFVVRDEFIAAYPGALQGSSPREVGPKGCLLVRAEGSRVTEIEHRPLDVLRWTTEAVSVDGAETDDTVLDVLRTHVEAISRRADGRPTIARLRLVGTTDLDQALRGSDLAAMRDEVREHGLAQSPWIWVEWLRAETSPALDWEAIRAQGDSSVQGFALTVAEAADDELLVQARQALRDLYGNAQMKGVLPDLDDDELRAMLLRASQHAVGQVGA